MSRWLPEQMHHGGVLTPKDIPQENGNADGEGRLAQNNAPERDLRNCALVRFSQNTPQGFCDDDSPEHREKQERNLHNG